jgi:hypothetical protein
LIECQVVVSGAAPSFGDSPQFLTSLAEGGELLIGEREIVSLSTPQES